jgi:hypothetical protein
MTEENLDVRDEFLLQNGRRVHEVKEVKTGDILGIIPQTKADWHPITLNYVDQVHLTPTFCKFDYFPYAILKGPYFGFNISKDVKLVGYKFLSLNPESSTGRLWMPNIIPEEFSPEQKEEAQDFLDTMKEEGAEEDKKEERVYAMNEGPYKDLGSLIPSVELPSLSFLPQSEDLGELVKMIENSRGDIEALRTASHNLKRIFRCH